MIYVRLIAQNPRCDEGGGSQKESAELLRSLLQKLSPPAGLSSMLFNTLTSMQEGRGINYIGYCADKPSDGGTDGVSCNFLSIHGLFSNW